MFGDGFGYERVGEGRDRLARRWKQVETRDRTDRYYRHIQKEDHPFSTHSDSSQLSSYTEAENNSKRPQLMKDGFRNFEQLLHKHVSDFVAIRTGLELIGTISQSRYLQGRVATEQGT